MRTVGVGVGRDDDLAVAQVLLLEGGHQRRADDVLAAAERDQDRVDLGVVERLAVLGAEHVEDLAADRQDRLRRVVARLLGAAAGRVALDDEDLAVGVRDRRVVDRVGELARQVRVAHDRRRRVAELLRDLGLGEAHVTRQDHAVEDLLGVVGVRLVGEPLGQRLPGEGGDRGLGLLVVQPALGLALELGVLEHHRDRAGEAVGDVLGVERLALVLLQSARVVGGLVEHAREGTSQTGDVRAAVDGVDDVAEAEDAVVGGHRPLQRDLDRDAAGLTGQGDDAGMGDLAALVELADVIGEALGAAVLVLGAVGRAQLEGEVADQERLLAQALLHRDRGEVRVLVEDRAVGREADGRAGALALRERPHLLHRAVGDAALVALAPQVLVAADLDLEPFGQRVGDARADAVQAARDLVAAVAELAAGVQLGEDQLERRDALLGVDVDGDAAAVVGDRDDLVLVHHGADRRAAPGQRLVDGVVDDLPDQVVQRTAVGAADVHAGPHAHGLEALEHTDIGSAVAVLGHRAAG